MNRLKEIVKENKTRSEKRREERANKVEERRSYRLEKIKALTAKFYAVAAKRKWLVFMMALGIAIYFIVSSGGLGKISSFFQMFK